MSVLDTCHNNLISNLIHLCFAQLKLTSKVSTNKFVWTVSKTKIQHPGWLELKVGKCCTDIKSFALTKKTLSALFQTYRFSSLRPVEFVVILYGCILLMLMLIYKLLCSVSPSFFWTSFPFTFHGSKQHFGTVRGLLQCICNPDRIYNVN